MDLFDSDRSGDPTTGATPASEPGPTPPPTRAPHAGSLDFGDWDTVDPPSPTRRWLLVAAVVPWIVVAAILVAGFNRGDAEAPAAQAASSTPAPDGSGSPVPEASSSSMPALDAAVSPSGAPTAAAPRAAVVSRGPDLGGRAVGLAAVAARAWLSTRPSTLPIEGLTPDAGADERYVADVVVENVDYPARGALVVAVRAVVLPIEGATYGEARQVRVAVPIAVSSGEVELAGSPWRLPTTTLSVTAPQAQEVDDPDLALAAVAAVKAAGYRDVALVRLERTEGWAWLASVDARAPGSATTARHVLWLRTDVGALVVAGTVSPPGNAAATLAPTTDGPTGPSETQVAP